jgi:hypothetical protein
MSPGHAGPHQAGMHFWQVRNTILLQLSLGVQLRRQMPTCLVLGYGNVYWKGV